MVDCFYLIVPHLPAAAAAVAAADVAGVVAAEEVVEVLLDVESAECEVRSSVADSLTYFVARVEPDAVAFDVVQMHGSS